LPAFLSSEGLKLSKAGRPALRARGVAPLAKPARQHVTTREGPKPDGRDEYGSVHENPVRLLSSRGACPRALDKRFGFGDQRAQIIKAQRRYANKRIIFDFDCLAQMLRRGIVVSPETAIVYPDHLE
jgi:hypothetical protein